MSLIATLALATSGAVLPSCSWDHPGINPFMGDVIAAVDDYKDIPASTRAKLKERMAKRDYDELVLIERDGISGMGQYSAEITDMHFGTKGMCRTITRSKWTQQMKERGLVYCEDGQCLLIPTICRNLSRIKRTGDGPLLIAPGAGVPSTPASPGGTTFTPPTPDTPLDFAPPGAGIPLVPTETPLSVPPVAPTTTPTVPTAPPPPLTILPPGTTPPVTVTPPTTPAVPEPSTWLMFSLGLLGISIAKHRRS